MHHDKSPGFSAGLYGLVDDRLRPELPIANKVKLLVTAGLAVVQLRLKNTDERSAVAAIRQAVAWTRGTQTKVLVNDRVDWALLGAADGVHLGADDVPVEVARRVLGHAAIIGATARTADDIERSLKAGANYVGLGPVFPSTTKAVEETTLGIEGVARIARHSALPIIAIAGLRHEHLCALRQAGAYGAAVGAALWNSHDVKGQARAMNSAFLGS